MSKRRAPRKVWKQLDLDAARKPTGHGGWRPGAGRPKKSTQPSHAKRPEIVARHPLHVTWRTGADAPGLRSYYPNLFIQESITASNREGFRVVEYSIQSNHLHLVVEANSKRELERGMRRLARRIVARMKTKFEWQGKLFTRYHARSLATPREVRNALRYVLLNMRHHVAAPGVKLDHYWVDPYSSGYWFDGWKYPIRGNIDLMRRYAGSARSSAVARTWLLAVGWRRSGLLEFDELSK